jgi:hypothetical protein
MPARPDLSRARRLLCLGAVALVCAGPLGTAPASAAGEQGRLAFTLAGRPVAPGQRADIDIPVPAGATDPATSIAVTVFHGAATGPVLALTAGVHGYEYPPSWRRSNCSRASTRHAYRALSSWCVSRTSRPSNSACRM